MSYIAWGKCKKFQLLLINNYAIEKVQKVSIIVDK